MSTPPNHSSLPTYTKDARDLHTQRTRWAASRPDDPHPWTAKLRMASQRTRPTWCIEHWETQLDIAALQKEMHPHAELFACERGLAVLESTNAYLRLGFLLPRSTQAFEYVIDYEPLLIIARAPHPAQTPEQRFSHALSNVHPFIVLGDHNRLSLHVPHLFAKDLDNGWNLPIVRNIGRYRIVSTQHTDTAEDAALPAPPWALDHADTSLDTAAIRLRWDEHTQEQNHTGPERLDPAITQHINDYAQGLPIAISLLSATTLGDEHGAHIAMRIAALAASHSDRPTLQALYITQQRIWARQRYQIGSLCALISAHATLRTEPPPKAWGQRLSAQVAHVLERDDTRTWFQHHLDDWLASATPRDAESNVAPHAPHTLRDIPAHTPHAPSSTAAASFYAQALDAFEEDADKEAWSLIVQALEHHETVVTPNVASMILRLVKRYGDDDEDKALRAIIDGDATEEQTMRAMQLLSEYHDAHGALPEAIHVLRAGQERYPQRPLLCIAYAQLLTRNGHADAVNAWDQVLALAQLEPWERAAYQEERDAAARWLNATEAPSKTGRNEAQQAPPHDAQPSFDAAMRALRILLFSDDVAIAPSTQLDEIEQALAQRPAPDARALLLSQRAFLYLQQKAYDRAAQAWTGALILDPDNPILLGGMALTRTCQQSPHDADTTKNRWHESLRKYQPQNERHAQALEVLRAFLK